MKQVLSYYLLPIVFFLLLSFSQLHQPDSKAVLMTTLASISIGLLAGFVLHITMIIKKKVSK
ncbi:hypothetical protein ACFFHM_25175 [Halalkalibacter kiskunsagensis]|uniref:Uncharacterized protein n=1 Tax=Halalkalibacter kiskunsagensis TaxID=1548599 RepID=A0ABV6KNZ3_9BACI